MLSFLDGFHLALYLPVGMRQELHGLHLLLEILEEDEEHGHEEQDGQDAEQHAAHDARTERRVAVGPRTAGEHQRQQAEYHGQDRHQNGAEAHAGGSQGGLNQRHTCPSAVGGILGQQDGRLGQQADEHDEARLHVDVVLQPHQLGKDKAAHQPERHGKDDGEGHEEALVQAAQDEVDEHGADEEDNGRVTAGLALFATDACELEAVASRQTLGCHFADGPDGVTRTVTRSRLAVDTHRTVEVESGERLGAIYFG